ncbi:hypothetical protein L917_09517, partial [Phytophthora nicotianae]
MLHAMSHHTTQSTRVAQSIGQNTSISDVGTQLLVEDMKVFIIVRSQLAPCV